MKVRANEEVREALGEGRPVVALESTIISHGMPYPQNVETAMSVERILREEGVVPATVGIVDGEGVVGLSEAEIEELGRRGSGVPKVSRRDLPVVMAEGSWGATTVATTMILAAKAGVEFFVTGGIGGVHRGAENTFDVSADLEELGRTNVTVICAGAKAILDLPKTLEVLETKGVPVLGFGTEELPAFYTRTSGLSVDRRVDDAEEVARIVRAKRELGLDGGVLVANPIPEQWSMEPGVINAAIEEALAEMDAAGVHGKECTPFLLAKVKEITGGDSLDANIQLVYNNARVGAAIARAYAGL
ncbi:MAG TPA: pseudouridine-5'-phosphate glycosidase [Candidatus Olsenella excrementigallinarum]|mgnify:CR=1 FL=1|uniref:pseudouridine-5'-phosphate glycosidase n=1 Tax=Olsenella timonensis TaxID=1805478 RepID=UPI00094ED571|nr:pseudouridine-5'-phosphate glycosidase [Olsenella timonensis]HJB48847.1 pseudouridine-5'-phosphate glycosidase [Candidatus Olsenella excrementigallinarum]